MAVSPCFVLLSPNAILPSVEVPQANRCASRTSLFGSAIQQRFPSLSSQSPIPYGSRFLPRATETTPPETTLSDDEKYAKVLKSLEGTQLKWAEIPFASIEEELAAIDEYAREENGMDDDPWPRFLRGAAYEHWGQPKLALAQYAKTSYAAGLRRVPELWERRGYNCFKIGNVEAAETCFEIALGLYYESTGNLLHFVHWFYDNFKDHVPRWNGPPATFQRAVCKYCVGKPSEARGSLLTQIELRNEVTEQSLLWFMASSVKAVSGGVMPRVDERVVEDALKGDYERHPRLQLLIKLYYAAAKGNISEVPHLEKELSEAVKLDEEDDVATHLYLALYYDAFTNDKVERDRALDVVDAIGGTSVAYDMENFLYHAARNRLSIPPGGQSPDTFIMMA